MSGADIQRFTHQLLQCCQHLPDRVAGAITAVQGQAFVIRFQILQSPDMRRSQVTDVDKVADAGAIPCRIIHTKNRDLLASTQGGFTGNNNPVEDAPVIQVDNTKRLHHGKKTREKLLGREKVSNGDGEIMAKNLGKMMESVMKHKPTLNPRKLFIEAFGEESGDNYYKKRKNLAVKSGEINSTNVSQKYGLNFVLFADTLAKHASSITNKDITILQLIHGSSYDHPDAYKERSRAEFEKEINKHLNQIGMVANCYSNCYFRKSARIYSVMEDA